MIGQDIALRCGSILKPIFCSACGAANPSGLGNCLQCGIILPDMTRIRWAPLVRVIQPTAAMNEKSDDKSNESQ